jgi:O-antigen/teichoic acid export membrane protein
VFDNVRRVSRQLITYGTADVSVLVINFFLLPVYTRVFTPAEYGALALLLVFEAFLKPMLRCGLDGAYVRQYYDERTDGGRKSLAATVLAYFVVSNLAVLAVIWHTGPWLTRLLLGSTDYAPALWLVAINTALCNLAVLPNAWYLVHERSTIVASFSFARSFSTVIARLILVVGFRKGIYGLMVADLMVSTALMLVYLPTQIGMVRGGAVSLKRLRGVLHFGLPQVPAGVLAQTMAMTDRYVLGAYLSLREVGVYSIGTTMASVLKLFPAAFSTAWLPFAFSSLGRKDAPAMFARQASYAFAVMCFGALGISAFAGPVVRLFLPASYHHATIVVPVLVLGITIQATTSFLLTSLNVARRTSRIPLSAAVGAVGSLAGSLVLVPKFGAMGAASGALCGQVAFAAATAWFAQRSYRIPYEVGRLTKASVVAALLGGVALLIPASAPLPGLAVAVLLVVSYPAILWAWNFLTPEEKSDIRRVAAAYRPWRQHLDRNDG